MLGDILHLVSYEERDPRTRDWPLSNSLSLLLGILGLYLLFVLQIGPRMMKNRKPFKLKTVLLFYNALQIAANAYALIKSGRYTYYGNYNFICQPFDRADTEINRIAHESSWIYFVLKLLDLADTIFFVLRKKQEQVTFLHVYHHTALPVLVWIQVNYVPNGHGLFFAFLNMHVHIIMYSYYLLSALRDDIQKNIWWKHYVTIIQIVQFIFIGFHFCIILWIECDYPKKLLYVGLSQAVVFLYLFVSFYIKRYTKKSQ